MPVFSDSGLETEELPGVYGSGEALGKAVLQHRLQNRGPGGLSASRLRSGFNVAVSTAGET